MFEVVELVPGKLYPLLLALGSCGVLGPSQSFFETAVENLRAHMLVAFERQEVLREQLDAPDAVVQAQGNRELIANELLDLPAGFGPINGFLYDNLVETWLIELGWDDPSDEPNDPEQTSGYEPD